MLRRVSRLWGSLKYLLWGGGKGGRKGKGAYKEEGDREGVWKGRNVGEEEREEESGYSCALISWHMQDQYQ